MTDQAETKITRVPGTPDEARTHAAIIATDTNREVVPVRIFEQADRTMLSGVLPVRVLVRVLAHNAAIKGVAASRALTAGNRPVDNNHVRGIAAYLRRAIEKKENYIIPSLTLNSTGSVEVFAPEGDYSPLTGYAVLPDEASVYITDGQHRYLAIKQVVDELRGTPAGDKFMQAGVPIMVTIESNTSQVHQDFADAGKTKPLPSSLLAVYDTRQPANAAVMEIGERTPLLRGRIDATSSTLSVNSPFIFLVNQVRQFVKSSLTGSPTVSEDSFAKHADAAMTNPEARERWVRSRVAFLNVMTQIIEDWSEIAKMPLPGGPESSDVLNRTKTIRERKRVTMTAAFLNTLGVVSHNVLKETTGETVDQAKLESELHAKLEPFRDIEWERSAEIWAGNLVVEGKIRTQTPALKAAADKLMHLLES